MTSCSLVTGGAGFIGTHLVKQLVENGERTRIFDSAKRLDVAGRMPHWEEIEYLEGDVRDLAAVRSAVAGVDRIYHLAGISSVQRSIDLPVLSTDVNLQGTVSVLEAARWSGKARVVIASSAAVYGEGCEPRREDMRTEPASPYAVSKLAAEHMCFIFSALYGLETVALRYFNVYGSEDVWSPKADGVIDRFASIIRRGETLRLNGDGSRTRDFVHVSDVVAANLLAGTGPVTDGSALNVGTGTATSINELIVLFEELVGREIPVERVAAASGEIEHSVADPSKAAEAIGFAATTDLAAGLAYMRKDEWQWTPQK